MENEELNFNQMLTWEDILALGCPFGSEVIHIDSNFFHMCCTKNHHKDLFDQNVMKYLLEDFKKEFPDFPYDNPVMPFCITPTYQNNHWCFKISKHRFALWLMYSVFDNGLKPSNIKDLTDAVEEGDDDYQSGLRAIFRKHVEYINGHIAKMALGFGTMEYRVDDKKAIKYTKEDLQKNRKNTNWCIRNLDKLFEYVEKEIPLEIFSSIDKDKFLLAITSEICSWSGLEKDYDKDTYLENLEDPEFLDFINYLSNYKLMIEYLEFENNKPYQALIHQMDDHICTSNDILATFSRFDSMMKDCKEYQNRDGQYHSYEELLSDRASKTWKRIQNEKLAKSIRLNWDMIPSGENVTLKNYSSNHSVMVKKVAEESQTKLKKAYDLVEKKLAYFENTPSIASLTGINNFKGYAAFMYPNGVVVLEKFFKMVLKKNPVTGIRQEVETPVVEEAIYMMNVLEFAELSKYTKPELIEEISVFENPDVKRVYHTKNWEKRVTKAINGPGYTEFDLEDLNALSEKLSEKQKVKTMTE